MCLAATHRKHTHIYLNTFAQFTVNKQKLALLMGAMLTIGVALSQLNFVGPVARDQWTIVVNCVAVYII